MDKLYLLFGILTLVFLLAIFGMNIAASFYTNTTTYAEPFAASGPSAIEKKIRASMDKLALYMAPDGSPATEGRKVCDYFVNLRDGMEKNEAKTYPSLAPSEISKRVDAALKIAIPGGPLPCPLLQYPVAGSTDVAWVTWLQNIPVDFGARVVFMIVYADEKITPTEKTLRDAAVEIQAFVDICTPDLTTLKEKSGKADSCVMPKDITPAQLDKTADTIISQLQAAAANTISKQLSLTNPNKIYEDMKMRVARTQKAIDYINSQRDMADKSGLTDSVKKVGSSSPAPIDALA
jgi:hypothetical protein